MARVTLALIAVAATIDPARAWTLPKGGAAPRAQSIRVDVAVFGTDDRVILSPDRRDLRSRVGVMVDLNRRTVCTAFCIGVETVVTAAHCLYPPHARDRTRLSAIRFRPTLPDRANEASIAGSESGGGQQFVTVGTTRLNLKPPIDAARDWAIARLDRPVCPAGGLPISRRPTEEILALARSKRIYQVAFHADFQDFRLALGAPCPAATAFTDASAEAIARDFERPQNILLHTCDTGGSSSGSPLLVDGPDGPEVVGLNVGTYLQSATAAATAVGRRSSADIPSPRAPPRDIANTAIASHTIADLADAFARADIIADPATMAAIQMSLARRNLYAGRVDGLYGGALKLAIETFEAQSGWPVTGIASRAIWERLQTAAD